MRVAKGNADIAQHRTIGEVAEVWKQVVSQTKRKIAHWRFPNSSAFSKSMGLTLCGIADEPTSLSLIFCLK